MANQRFCSQCGSGNESVVGLQFCVVCGSPLVAALYGRYEVKAVIGQGANGVVLLAYDPLLNRPTALRILNQQLIEDRARFRRLENAVRVMANTNHPHWVQVYDLDRENTDIAVVMEYVDGTSIASLIRQAQPLEPQACAAALAGALDGVTYLHSLGLVHGDLTPHNVLLNREGQSKIADVSGVSDSDPQGIALGYLSAEQLRGQPASVPADVYALGALLYGMSTGRPPFVGDTVTSALTARHTPVDTSTMDAGLASIVEACMDSDPVRRPSNTHQVAEMLATVASAQYGPKWRSRGTAMLAGAAVGSAAAVIASGASSAVLGGAAAASGTTAVSTTTTLTSGGIFAAMAAKPVVVAAVAAGAVATAGAGTVTYEKLKEAPPVVTAAASQAPAPALKSDAPAAVKPAPKPTPTAVPAPIAANIAQGTTNYKQYGYLLTIKRSGDNVIMQKTETTGPGLQCFKGKVAASNPTLEKSDIEKWPYYFVGKTVEGTTDGQFVPAYSGPSGFDPVSRNTLEYGNAGEWTKTSPSGRPFVCT